MTPLERIVELTAAIEDRVRDGQWADATALDSERRALLEALFAGDPSVVRNPATRQVLEQLRARNDGLALSVAQGRDALSVARRRLEQAPAIVRAYESNLAPAVAGRD